MKSFLEYVAADIVAKHGSDLARTAIVFPNKRASLFIGDHFARLVGKPLWSPEYVTISDLFRTHSPLTVADPIKLVSDLHRCFTKCMGISETLDHFFGWGQVLLADFDDVDKSMADAAKVFANVSDLHELDDLSYLTEEQAEAIRRFFSNFSEDKTTELKRRFLMLWNRFHDVYTAYNERLASQRLAYEGALYRSVVADEAAVFERERYIFVGFNVVQNVERCLFKRLRREGKAFFYWDFDRYFMPKGSELPLANEAGRYIASCLDEFPNELDTASDEIYDNFSRPKQIAFVSSPTENMQARFAGSWLLENGRIEAGRRTAVVLCDEALLGAVLHSLPDSVGNVNITTGFPLSKTPFGSLLASLFALQAIGYSPSDDTFRLRSVNAVLRHPYARYVSPSCAVLYASLNGEARVRRPRRDQLIADDGLALLFGDIGAGHGDMTLTWQVAYWIVGVLQLIAKGSASDHDSQSPLFQEALFRTYTLMNRMLGLVESGDLAVDLVTFQGLVAQAVQSTSIPFHGEPAVGVQVMGVLGTRNLDFDHVLLLSCNEGNMPKGIGDTSFIPHSIRRAYGLTTIDNKVDIYSYYFHSLLSRASDVTIAYNNSTTDSAKNEMSRFMLQLLVEGGHDVRRLSLTPAFVQSSREPRPVEKGKQVMEKLLARFAKPEDWAGNKRPLLTPTAINRYLRCQLQFYFNYVCNMREPDATADDGIDGRMFGNIFHAAAQTVYGKLAEGRAFVTASMVGDALKDKAMLARAVDDAFAKELFKLPQGARKRPDYNGLQLISREVIIAYLRRLLKTDEAQAPFRIVALEKDVLDDFTVKSPNLTFTTVVGGRVDRLDCVGDVDSRLRVVDYKTGSPNLGKMPDVAALFDPARIAGHSGYFLQAFLYADIVRRNPPKGFEGQPVSPALLFVRNAGHEGYDPTLCLGDTLVADIATVAQEFRTLLAAKVGEIFDASLPFVPTSDQAVCSQCPYRQLCQN